MGKKRSQYTKEYKNAAVRLIVEEGRPISEVACELRVFEKRWERSSNYESNFSFMIKIIRTKTRVTAFQRIIGIS